MRNTWTKLWIALFAAMIMHGCHGAPKNKISQEQIWVDYQIAIKDNDACIDQLVGLEVIDSIFSQNISVAKNEMNVVEVERFKLQNNDKLNKHHMSLGAWYRNKFINSTNNFTLWSELCYMHPDDVSASFIQFWHAKECGREFKIVSSPKDKQVVVKCKGSGGEMWTYSAKANWKKSPNF